MQNDTWLCVHMKGRREGEAWEDKGFASALSQCNYSDPKWNISLEWQISLFNMEERPEALWWLFEMSQWWISPFANETVKPNSPWPEEPQQERSIWERRELVQGSSECDNTGFTWNPSDRFAPLMSLHESPPPLRMGASSFCRIPS